jgi:hypothetical protein
MRRLPLLLAAMVLLASVEPASACSRAGPPPSDEELFAKASAVFVAHVFLVEEAGPTRAGIERSIERAIEVHKRMKPDFTSAEETAMRERLDRMPPMPSVEATFRVVEVLKGQPPPDGKIRALPFVLCSGALAAGVDYLFFLYRGTFVFVDADDGTRPLYTSPRNDPDGEMEREQRQLVKLRELSKTVQK